MFTHDPWNAELTIHDLIDAIEGIFLVDKRIQEDSQRPHVLFFATVRLPLKNFRSGII